MSSERERAKILVVDDDEGIRDTIEMILGDEGYSVCLRKDGASGYDEAIEGDYNLVLTDFRMPGMGGLELIGKLVEEIPQCPVILMTAHGNTDLAIEATKLGAFDYLLKPFEISDLLEVVEKGVSASQRGRSRTATSSVGRTDSTPEPKMLGNSRAMQGVYKEIGRVAPTEATVIVFGETGTGKELVAKAVHQHSPRSNGPFVAVNCGAIPENLLESELFGHIKGAFTGADANRIGRFEQAEGGTLFLDEIGDMPLPVQVKLLRVLQEGTFQALGASREKKSDVRIIAATHRDLRKMIQEETFREDLFFRLSAMQISLPSLRERREDISLLATSFVRSSAEEYGVSVPQLSPKIVSWLEEQGWPGNIRQLQNVLRYVVLHSRGFAIQKELLEEAISGTDFSSESISESDRNVDNWIEDALSAAADSSTGNVHGALVGKLESRLIRKALQKSGGHLGKATEWLGISRVTLRKKMNELGIQLD